MSKKNKILLLSLLSIFLLFYSSSSFALEINPESYPEIPFTDPITAKSQLPHYIVYFFALGIYLAGALAVISLAVGGIQLIFSSVSPEARNNALDKIKNAILGLVLLLASVIIIQTINPALEELENKEILKETGGLRLEGSPGKSKAAPMFAGDLDEIKRDYSRINWPETVNDLKGNPIPNCDPKTSGVYLISWYKDKNFKKLGVLERLKCGESKNFTWAKSYFIVKEQPGVYFYAKEGCEPKYENEFPTNHTKSIPQWKGVPEGSGREVKSIRIVNGSDPIKGPFFGAMIFTDQDYKTDSAFWHLKFNTTLSQDDDYSQCINYIEPPTAGSKISSVIIYKWAGFNEDKTPNINCSVTLYSKGSWTGGSYTLYPHSGNYTYNGPLENVPVTYFSGSKISEEEQKQCPHFIPKYDCLQSFEIKGDCLVLVSSKEDTADVNHWVYHTGTVFGGREPLAQVFPVSPRLLNLYKNRPDGYSVERGTPELVKDYITSGNAKFMMIIPLAENLVSSH